MTDAEMDAFLQIKEKCNATSHLGHVCRFSAGHTVAHASVDREFRWNDHPSMLAKGAKPHQSK